MRILQFAMRPLIAATIALPLLSGCIYDDDHHHHHDDEIILRGDHDGWRHDNDRDHHGHDHDHDWDRDHDWR